jgi:hypothetical protein
MPLQTGAWTINIGGDVTQLQIDADPVSGALFAHIRQAPVFVVWDEDSQRVILMMPLSGELFIGYLFTDTVNLTGVNGSIIFTLVGSVEIYQPGQLIGLAPTAERSTFGWYAQIGVD